MDLSWVKKASKYTSSFSVYDKAKKGFNLSSSNIHISTEIAA